VREVKAVVPTQSIENICTRFGKSRQAFYQLETRRQKEMIDSELILFYVRDIRKQQPRIGARKMHRMLKAVMIKNKIKLGRDKFFALLKRHGLLVKKRRNFVKTTNSYHRFKKYPNMIKALEVTSPEKVWVSDITYIPIERNKFVYLSLITDIYSKRIMGYCVHPSLESIGPLKALDMALKNRTYHNKSIIHHSDKGAQYCSEDYISCLNKNRLKISMTSEKKCPEENTVAERINGILKSEYYIDTQFRNIQDARLSVKNAIELYNNNRPHLSCDYLTPSEAHLKSWKLKKHWKDYHKLSKHTINQDKN